jgi:hypothetical protein
VDCKHWTMRLGLCKWCYSPFWLVSCKFCDNMSPWNNTLAIMKIGTCNHENWHIWSRKVIHVTIKKFKTYTCNLEKTYHEICNHENYFNENFKNLDK